MKISTWIDRLAGVVLALAIARVLGPDALGEWTLVLVTVWVLSPWPEGSLTTRLSAGLLGLAGVACVSWAWTAGWERHALLWTVAVGMFSIRIVHALPGHWRWRLMGSSFSFIIGLVTLLLTKSVLATSLAVALAACAVALIGSIRYRAALGAFAAISWRRWFESLIIMLIQAQVVLWAYARGLSETDIGELAAVLFIFECFKVGLVVIAVRFDVLLEKFAETRESFLETVRSMAAYALLFMPPFVLGAYFLAGPLVNWTLGPSFSTSVSLMRILIWGFGLSFLSLIGTRVLAVKGHRTLTARVTAGAIEAGLDWFWIPMMGLEGACYARVIGEALFFLFISVQMVRDVPDLINPFRKTFG